MRRRFDDAPDRLAAGLVTAQPRQTESRGPAPVAVHDDSDVKSCRKSGGVLTLHCKAPGQKRGSGRRDAKARWRTTLLAGGVRGVAHQAFEDGEIVEKATATGLGQAAGRVRPVALIAL